MLGASATALADGHGGGGDVVAMQVHYCTLNDGKDMADVDKALCLGVRLLLAHEMKGAGGQEARFGCDFETYGSQSQS